MGGYGIIHRLLCAAAECRRRVPWRHAFLSRMGVEHGVFAG